MFAQIYINPRYGVYGDYGVYGNNMNNLIDIHVSIEPCQKEYLDEKHIKASEMVRYLFNQYKEFAEWRIKKYGQ
jgi:hypothetical protein